jgi:hypothetical protein
MKRLRLWACVARVFVESNGVIAGTEALVVEDGTCVVPRSTFLKLLQSYKDKQNLTIEADSSALRVGSTTLGHLGYTPTAVPLDRFDVFPVTDTWIPDTIGQPHPYAWIKASQAAYGGGAKDSTSHYWEGLGWFPRSRFP